jgi:hypothetical protein
LCGGVVDVPSPFYRCSLFLPHKQWLAMAIGVAVVVVVVVVASLGMNWSFRHCCVIVTQLDLLD